MIQKMTARSGTYRSRSQGLKLMLTVGQLSLEASVKQGQRACFSSSKKDISMAAFINVPYLSSHLAPGLPTPSSYFFYAYFR